MTPILLDKMSNQGVTSITVKEAQNHISEIREKIKADDIPVMITHQG